ncbi:MAG: glycosyltransferase family 4 protein [Halanaerobiales bacterium]|nr:glycosyltransferase family 4 protein [Halanaerobiales bacterium]
MKILLVANKDITLYLFRKEFIEELLNKNYEVFILCPTGNKLDYFKERGCTVFDLNMDRHGTNPIKEFLNLINIFKVIKRVKPKYVFTYTVKPNIYTGIVSRILEVKVIPTITGLGSTRYKNKFFNKLIKTLYKVSFRKAHCTLFQNKGNLQWFKKNIFSDLNYKLVNGSGVNLDKFSYKAMKNKNKTHFLFLGRIMREKGIDELIEAATMIKDKYSDKILIEVAGFFEEDYKNTFKILEKRNIIKYIGFIDNPEEHIAKAHAVILPSYHEGLSNVLLEAQAIGRAVIASNIPGCIETFIDVRSGYAVEKRNAKDLFLKMQKFHHLSFKEKLKMGEVGREYILNNFDRKKIIKDYMEIIK